ncbi:alpha/beta hydrolase family protein [Larkinella rosea]|uniref:Peptidase n=1 Tax=Larkinella rosea TaxID=2025312 RepID=A0A3P1BPN7_9BACT|nr:prolyl oligopeptidase family serine peptidase [Larkinella rosea]RRB02484.1 peptidase [Larkinella rosea]
MQKPLFWLLLILVKTGFAQRPDFLKKDSIQSSLDGNTQVFYYDRSRIATPQPLVVELHSWSNSADSQKDMLAVQANAKSWNYIFPNFRGVNNHPKACCSDFVISDIDEAIDWALKNLTVDPKRIYVVGTSGGGYATLAMYMKSRHAIHTFSAWASISDLSAWYGESVERKNKYAAEIVQCTGATGGFDAQKARERSPLFWKTPVKKRKNSHLQIYAGIHDGYTGSVPISHSIRFYNKVVTDFNARNKGLTVSEKDAEEMLKTQTFPATKPPKTIGDRAVLYQKKSGNNRLTIFEGTHEILKDAALEQILAW